MDKKERLRLEQAKRFKRLMAKFTYGRQTLAKDVDETPEAVDKWRQGYYPKLENQKKIAKLFDMPVSEVFPVDEETETGQTPVGGGFAKVREDVRWLIGEMAKITARVDHLEKAISDIVHPRPGLPEKTTPSKRR